MKLVLLLTLMLPMLSACLPNMGKSALQFKPRNIPSVNPQTPEEEEARVSFEDLKTKLLEPKCLGCHGKWKDEAEFQAKHVILGDPDGSKMVDSVRAARMPKGRKLPDGTREPVVPLETAEVEMLYNYIKFAKPVIKEEVKPQTLANKHINLNFPPTYLCYTRLMKMELTLDKDMSSLIVRDLRTGEYYYNGIISQLSTRDELTELIFETNGRNDLELTFKTEDINTEAPKLYGFVRGWFGAGHIDSSVQCQKKN